MVSSLSLARVPLGGPLLSCRILHQNAFRRCAFGRQAMSINFGTQQTHESVRKQTENFQFKVLSGHKGAAIMQERRGI